MDDECGWQRPTPAATIWAAPGAAVTGWGPTPWVLMLEDGGFLELENCDFLGLEG